MKQVSGLFVSSLRYLLFLEIIFKLLGVWVVLPLANGILQIALRFSSIQYIATQNYQLAFSQPILVVGLILIVVLIVTYLNFEVSCITISYHQVYCGHTISYYQLLKESGIRSLKLYRPSNWLLLPFSIFLLPTLFYFLQNSSNVYIKIVIKTIEDLLVSFPGNLIIIGVGIMNLMIAILGMYAFQFHITQHISGWRALLASLRLLKNHWKQVCSGVFYWMLILAVSLAIFHGVLYLVIRLGVYLLAAEDMRQAYTATIYYYVKSFINFISSSLMAFGWYGYVASSYFRYTKMHSHMTLYPILRRKDPRAKKRGSITVGVLGGFILLTLLINAIVIRSADTDWGSDLWGEKISIMAHRGASREYPENTLLAFKEAAAQGADYIELDCQLSKDGVVVVHHDPDLKRCWNVSDSISQLTLEELKKIHDEHGQQIPTLAEVLTEMEEEWIEFNIELKVDPFDNKELLAQAVMEVIQEYGLQERCIIQSFNYEALEAVKAIDDSIPCGYILTTAAGQYYDLEAADFFSMNISFLTERAVASAHLRNKKIMVWTVNTEEYLKEAVRMKVDGIITDDPVLAREVVYGSQLSLEEFLEEELVLEEIFQDTILE